MKRDVTVWLVEDSAIYRRGLARAIDRADGMCCTGQFETAEEALDALGEKSPDVVMLDVGLPGMSGLDALAEFRRRAPEARLVVLTVFDDADKIFAAVCSGANGYLLKTGPTSAVVEAVQQAAEGGAPMTPEVAARVLKLFSQCASSRPSDDDRYGLTARETEVLELLAEGLVTKQIAVHLEVSRHTVTNHLRSIYAKLHVTTNTGAVAKAIRERLI